MKICLALTLVMVLIVGALVMVNCKQKSAIEPVKTAGVGERTGAALDQAAENAADKAHAVAETTGEAVNNAAAKTEAVAEKNVEKTGEALENSGAAIEHTGSDLQK